MKNTIKGGTKMNKTLIALGIALIAVLAIGGAYAYQTGNRYNASVIDKDAAQKAVDSGNYASWKEMHANANSKMASLVNENNFHLLQKMQKARESGDYIQVRQIQAELGFTTEGKGNAEKMHRFAGKSRNARDCPYAN